MDLSQLTFHRFKRKERGYWKDHPERQKQFVEQLMENWQIENPEDLKNFTLEDIRRSGGYGLLHYFGNSWMKALKAIFPEENANWKHKRGWNNIPKAGSRGQLNLLKAVQEIFPNTEVVCNFSIPRDMKQNKKLGSLEFDIFIPSLSLAIEYQGMQHYADTNVFGSVVLQQQRVILDQIFFLLNLTTFRTN